MEPMSPKNNSTTADRFPMSSSAMASGLPDAALGAVSPRRPVPAQEMFVHAQGLITTRGGQGPRDDGPVAVAFCMPRRHRHPELHCFRRSMPRLYAPLVNASRAASRQYTAHDSGSVWRYSFTMTDFRHLPPAGLPGALQLNGSPAAFCGCCSSVSPFWPFLRFRILQLTRV